MIEFANKKVVAVWFDHFVSRYLVGSSNVTKIEYHYAAGEGDKHYCDIEHSNGKITRLFTFDSIEWEPV